jgi:ubiquitin
MTNPEPMMTAEPMTAPVQETPSELAGLKSELVALEHRIIELKARLEGKEEE